MPADAEMVNVFRSADEDGEEDARAVQELLAAQGIDAVLLDDGATGVPSGAWEVHVPASSAEQAEQIIDEADLPGADLLEVDDSAALDAETVFEVSPGTTNEFEALSVQGMLESAGIATVMVGDTVLPNLPFQVQVAKENAEEARQLIADAQAIGPSAAEEEAEASETPLNP